MNAQDLLTPRLGEAIVLAGGRDLAFNCPFCSRRGKTPDTKHKLSVTPSRGLWHCYRCESGGRLDRLYAMLGLQPVVAAVPNWGDVLRRHRALSGTDYREPYDASEEIEYPCFVRRPPRGSGAHYYLTGPKTEKFGATGLFCRGLTEDQIDRYRIVVGSGDRWGSRIFVPEYRGDILTFWSARDYSGLSKVKYLSSPGRQKNQHVGHLHQVREKHKDVVIAEGVFSAIAAGPNGVWCYGKTVSMMQIRLLVLAGFRTYYAALDGDALIENLRLAQDLYSWGCNVRVVCLPHGQDPDSVENFQDYLENSVPYSFQAAVDLRISRSSP